MQEPVLLFSGLLQKSSLDLPQAVIANAVTNDANTRINFFMIEISF
jgi:hypothetical protein